MSGVERLYRQALSDHRDEKKAAKATIKQFPEPVRTRIEALRGEVTFTVRRYSHHSFCWPQHPLFARRPTDPWPGARFPEAVLVVEIAMRDPDCIRLLDSHIGQNQG